MSHSWLNNSQQSTGFVYYDLDTTPSEETPDFLKFSECSPSPQSRRFNPSNFSSPYQNRRGSPRGYNKRGRMQGGNQQNTSYSPNTSYNKSSYSGNQQNTSFSPSNSYNKSPYNNNSWVKSRDSSFNNKSRNESFAKSNFLHPSFMEDPWADLEKQLNYREKRDQDLSLDSFNQSISSTSNSSFGSCSNKRDSSEMT